MNKIIALITLSLLTTPVLAESNNHELSKKEVSEAKSSELRLNAIKDFAIQKGLVDGRKFRFSEIAQVLQAQKKELDIIYSVDHLYITTKGGLFQVPVVLTGKNLYQMDNMGQSYDWSEVRYTIGANGRFVTSKLDWFTYLVNEDDLHQVGPADDPLLKPRNNQEANVYQTYYQNAYAEGINQANLESVARTKSLTTIKTGMIDYHTLVAKKILEPVEITSSYIPVTGNSTVLTLSTTASMVSKDAKFNHNPDNYQLGIVQ